MAHPEPTPVRPAPVARPAPAHAHEEATSAQAIVVPISLPPGGRSAEIVIRIVLKPSE
jgi:hypothetical protein